MSGGPGKTICVGANKAEKQFVLAWPPRIKASSPRSGPGLDARRPEELFTPAERVCEQVYERLYTWVYVSKKVFASPSQAQRVFVGF